MTAQLPSSVPPQLAILAGAVLVCLLWPVAAVALLPLALFVATQERLVPSLRTAIVSTGEAPRPAPLERTCAFAEAPAFYVLISATSSSQLSSSRWARQSIRSSTAASR